MDRLKAYILGHFEEAFVLLILVSVAFINYWMPQKVTFLNFYFLPVIVAGYLVGVRLSVLGAVFCVLLVTTYTLLYPQLFTMPGTREELFFHLLAWGGFLILAGAVVGKQQESLRQEIQQTRRLNEELSRSYTSVQNARTATIMGLAKLAEYRDEDTGAHLERMREYARILAEELARQPAYLGYITQDYVDDLYLSSILHDIGKVGIGDSILLKPGRLTADEFEVMKRHTSLGGDALGAVEPKHEVKSFLTLGKEVAYCHHERWDGTGYPRGLRGDEIPLSARIVALADAYDALTAERVYKRPMAHREAVREIDSQAGRHFDPSVVAAFLAREAEFDRVRLQFHGDAEPAALDAAAG